MRRWRGQISLDFENEESASVALNSLAPDEELSTSVSRTMETRENSVVVKVSSDDHKSMQKSLQSIIEMLTLVDNVVEADKKRVRTS